MKLKIGDYVRFLNERQEGVITRIIDHQVVGVTIEDDFEINVAGNELVVVSSAETQLLDEEVSIEDLRPIRQLTEEGIYLALARNEKANSIFDLQLINSTDYQLLISCSGEENNNHTGLYAGIVEPHKWVHIATYPMDTVELWPIFHLQCIYHSKNNFQPKQPLIVQQRIKPKSIFGNEQLIPLNDRKGFVFQVDKGEVKIDTERLKESISASKTAQTTDVFIPSREVDLHIEELTEDFPKMNPTEMLNYQVAHFNRCLDSAIAHNFESIIFIHGVGNGTLRYEIQKKLSKHQQVRTFKDARKDKFGYGATEVLLK